ncbi:MAG: adenylate/guanylate cyclase domain-containing protein [Chitinispirillia bacterium]|jgi:adenylate cyclase
MAYLEFINSTYPEKQRYFNNEITIGRTPDNDICISEDCVSRRHAVIKYTNSYYVLEDLGSKNGVMLNNLRINSFVTEPIYDGDVICISSVNMVFYSEGRQPPSVGNRLNRFRYRQPGSDMQADELDGITVVIKQEMSDISSNATIIDAASSIDISKESSIDELKTAVKRFQAMVTISSEIGLITESEGLLEKIIDNIFKMFPQADRSFIMLPDKKNGFMKPVYGRRCRSNKKDNIDFKVSSTIINYLIENKSSVLSTNAPKDKRFLGGKSIADFSIQSLMYVPFLHKDEILGVITVDTTSVKHAFDKNDLAMLTGIAAQAAVALKNVQLYKEIQKETQLRTQLTRYLSSEVVEGILKGKVPFHLGGEEKYGTVLFCDIVGFTSLSESMTALEVIEKLNRYFRLFTDVITHNKGTLHKFEGDMVMAFWNVLIEDKNSEVNAVRSALEMQTAVWRLGLELEAEGDKPIHIGIGCNTGEFAGGNIGGKDKMEYTVIGDNINLGQRIESLASRWQVFVSESTYKVVKDKCTAIGLPKTVVKGRADLINVYSIRGIELYKGIMLLDIPIVIRDWKGYFSQRGILTGCCMEKGRLTLGTYTKCIVHENEKLHFRFFLPELFHSFQLSGKVHSVNVKSHMGKDIYSNCVLLDIHADDEVFELLRPGYFTCSDKSWDEMRRR